MVVNLIEKIKPMDIDTKKDHFLNTFGHCETEIVARNIVIISKKKGDWFDFTTSDYKCNLDHEYTAREVEELDNLVKQGYLNFHAKTKKYSVTNSFIEALRKYYI